VQFASFAYGTRTADDPAEDYHEAAKLYPSFAARQLRGMSLLEHPAFVESMRRSSRRHPHRPRVALPHPRPLAARLSQALDTRRSRAPEARSTLRLADLATLARAYEHDPSSERRRTPSGGALYPLELYVLARRVEALAPGVYHLDPFDRALELVDERAPVLDEALVDPAIGENAAALLVVTGMFWRSRCKYGLRGYRFTLLEAGHLVQTLTLLATAAGIDALPLGGFYDAALDGLVHADGVNESVVYAVAVGRPAR
jgi:SagB-type dehydrogenase family enzyme